MLDRAVTTMPAVAAPNMGWASTEAASRSLGLGLWLAVGIITGFGFSLRFYCAANDLWTDEIWSLQLVQGLRSPAEVLWGISHDNNHYLNSLWLYGLGPGHSARLYRLPAVLFGTLSVLAAARLGLRHSRATGLATAALVATSYLLVNYGSEARGYAGMVLALLIALDAFDRVAARAPSGRWAVIPIGRHRWIFGAAIGIGALSHLTLIGALPVFGAAMALRRARAGRSLVSAACEGLALLWPGLLLVVPALACVVTGIVIRGGFTFGETAPFELSDFLRGFSDMLHIATGLPETVPLSLIIGATGLGLLVAARIGQLDVANQCLVLAGLVVLPLAMALLRLPNLQHARYFLIPAVILIVAQGRIIGAIWDQGGPASWVTAAAILGVMLLGQIAWIQPLIEVGRGSYGRVLDVIASEGRPTYSSDSRFLTQSIVDTLAAGRNQTFDYVGASRWCATPPDWYIVVGEIGPERLETGSAGCPASFARRATFPTSALSGMLWTLYRRAGEVRLPIVDSAR